MGERLPEACPWCKSPQARGGGEYRCGSYHHLFGHIAQTQNCMNIAEHLATIERMRGLLEDCRVSLKEADELVFCDTYDCELVARIDAELKEGE